MLQEHEDKSFTFVPVKMWYQIRLFMKFENEYWDHFKGETWKREINVRDFIQSNYTPYEGDDSFLVASSEKTRKVWNKLTEMFKVEREKGVYDAETKLPQGIDV